MNATSWLEHLLEEALWRTPETLILLTAMLLALVFMRRAKKASIFTMLGASIMLATTVCCSIARSYVLYNRMNGEPVNLATYFNIIGIGSIVGHSLGMICLVSAIFVGRPPAERFDER